MPNIRIISVPPGEAPEDIRQAWVGVSLPLVPGHKAGPMRHKVAGALSGPKGFWGALAALVFRKYESQEGYAVDTLLAVEALARKSPEAANWWYREAPHLTQPGQRLIFHASVCEVEAA